MLRVSSTSEGRPSVAESLHLRFLVSQNPCRLTSSTGFLEIAINRRVSDERATQHKVATSRGTSAILTKHEVALDLPWCAVHILLRPFVRSAKRCSNMVCVMNDSTSAKDILARGHLPFADWDKTSGNAQKQKETVSCTAMGFPVLSYSFEKVPGTFLSSQYLQSSFSHLSVKRHMSADTFHFAIPTLSKAQTVAATPTPTSTHTCTRSRLHGPDRLADSAQTTTMPTALPMCH